jgi:immune inhibitor A
MRKILLLISFIMMAMYIHAVKVNPIPFSVTQSDGTTIIIKGYGDENFHWYTTLDGAILDHVGQNYYIANIDENGNITASSQLAHEKNIRSILEKKNDQ